MRLTKEQRLIIANQNRILALLKDEDHFNHLAEIAEYGYEGLFYQLFNAIHNGVPQEICDETFNILTMFSVIENSITGLTEEEKESLDLERLRFQGFDGNNDPHYGFTKFIIEKENRYEIFQGRCLNSHDSLTIDRYRRMMDFFRNINHAASPGLNYAQLRQISEIF